MSAPHDNVSRAVEAFQAGNYAKAEKFAAKALKKNPRDGQLYTLAGMACFSQDKFKAAVRYLDRAVAIDPENAAALGSLGMAHIGAGAPENALAPLQKAHALGIDDIEMRLALAQALGQTGDTDQALEVLRAAIPNVTGDPLSAASVGQLLREMGDYESSLSVLGALTTSAPNFAEGYAEYAYICRDLARLDDGLAAIEKAIALDPGQPRYHHNRAIILRYLMQFESAEAAAAEGLAIAPDDIDLHVCQSVNLFLQGRFEDAWPHFEKRRQERPSKTARPFLRKKWDGGPLDGRSLLVRAEQGVGDEVLCSTCLADLIDATRGESVTIEVDRRLVDMFARTYPELSFVPRMTDPGDLNIRCDVEIGFASLLPLYRPTLDVILNAEPRPLQLDTDRVAAWKKTFDGLGPSLKVGIAWRGGSTPLAKKCRSVALTEMLPILSVPGVSFINLQYGNVADEIAALKSEHGVTVHDWPDVDPLNDMETQADQIAALDLVLQISNASAHVSGALGQKTWMLQAAVPFWPWFAHRTDMPWYFDVTQYRMTDINDKSAVIAEIAHDLAGFVSSRQTQTSN